MKTLTTATILFVLSVALVPPAIAAPTPAEAKTPPPEAKRHASGLVTQVLQAGTGDHKPAPDDIVVLHFTGWDRQGKQFMSSRDGEKPQPATTLLSQVILGWREALLSMVEGEIRRVWVPDHLGAKSNRGPQSAVFDLELEEIREMPAAPASWEPPADAQRSPSGGRWQLIRAGNSEVGPEPGGTALVHWTAWTENGRMLDSTALRGRPTAFLLNNVFLAFSEVVAEMKLGEERFAWFPAAAHGGQWPGAPADKGLVFRLELLRVLPSSMFQPKR